MLNYMGNIVERVVINLLRLYYVGKCYQYKFSRNYMKFSEFEIP